MADEILQLTKQRRLLKNEVLKQIQKDINEPKKKRNYKNTVWKQQLQQRYYSFNVNETVKEAVGTCRMKTTNWLTDNHGESRYHKRLKKLQSTFL